jgi:hypothetical protein
MLCSRSSVIPSDLVEQDLRRWRVYSVYLHMEVKIGMLLSI